MGRKRIEPSAPPTREEAQGLVDAAVARHLEAAGLDAATVGYEARLNGRVLGDAVERIAIGYAMHRDDMAWPCYDIVLTRDADWRDQIDARIGSIARHVARLEARRASFDADGTAARAPRRAWDIHPVVSSLLSHYPRIPDLDGTHRIDGAVGRVVDVGARGNVEECVIGYGDGVVRLAHATFGGGATLSQDDDRTVLRFPGDYPDTIMNAFRGSRPGLITDLLGADPRSDRTKVTRVTKGDDGRVELTFADRLVPWDRRARGDEPWRRTRLAA